MKEITLRQMQEIELELLLAFDSVCKKHNLRYYLDGGTLLGAMCYEGFIPWDDDIDLKMPRPDYARFLTLQGEFPAHIRIDAPRKAHCEYTMTKLVDDRTVLIERNGGREKTTGVYIDIFPMDGHPEDEGACAEHIQKLQRLNSLFHHSLEDFASVKGWKRPVYRLLYTPWRLYRRLTETAAAVDYDKSRHVGLLIEGDPRKERFPKEWLEPAVMLEFEGHFFPAPGGYKPHLEVFYGSHITKEEYHHNLPMILPDHRHEVFWKEQTAQRAVPAEK